MPHFHHHICGVHHGERFMLETCFKQTEAQARYAEVLARNLYAYHQEVQEHFPLGGELTRCLDLETREVRAEVSWFACESGYCPYELLDIDIPGPSGDGPLETTQERIPVMGKNTERETWFCRVCGALNPGSEPGGKACLVGFCSARCEARAGDLEMQAERCPKCPGLAISAPLGDGELDCLDCGYYEYPVLDNRDAVVGRRMGYRTPLPNPCQEPLDPEGEARLIAQGPPFWEQEALDATLQHENDRDWSDFYSDPFADD